MSINGVTPGIRPRVMFREHCIRSFNSVVEEIDKVRQHVRAHPGVHPLEFGVVAPSRLKARVFTHAIKSWHRDEVELVGGEFYFMLNKFGSSVSVTCTDCTLVQCRYKASVGIGAASV